MLTRCSRRLPPLSFELLCDCPVCPHRPLVLGSRERNGKKEYCVASEDCAFGPIGFQRVRDVAPGEMLIVTGAQEYCAAKSCTPQASVILCEALQV